MPLAVTLFLLTLRGRQRSKPVSSQIRFISYMLFEYIYYASQTQLELPRRESTFRIKQSSCSHIYHCVLT